MRFLLLLLLVFLALGEASPAYSHAVLLETTPRDGARLEAPPTEVLLRFNEPVAPVVVRVVDGNGAAVALPGQVTARDTVIRLPFPDSPTVGSYVVSYRVTSADSHPVGGAFLFAVGQSVVASDALKLVRTDASGWQILGVVLRILFYAGLLVSAGGALFGILVDDLPRSLRGRLAALAGGAAIIGLASIGVQGALLINPPLSGLLEAETWRVGAASTRGTSMLLSVPGLLLLFFTLRSRVGGRLAQVLGAGLALSGFVVTGHAATASPVWLTAPSMAVHALAVAFWVGSLLPLAAILGATTPRMAAAVVVRFSHVAVVAVAALLIAGLALAFVQVEELSAIPETEYGLILAGKLAIVAGLLLIALYNKWRLTPALERAEAGAATRLRGAIRIEMAAIVAIFIATATLGAVPPPRTMAGHHHMHPHSVAAGQESDGVEEAVSAKGYKAVVQVNGPKDGPYALRVALTGADGAKLEPLQVMAEISNESAGVAAMSRKLAAFAPGEFELREAPFPFAGIWTVDIEALISDFEKTSWSVDVAVK